ncbi:MAG: hypothetical protein HRU75_11585 [Planctomycetia bacterium]|nr:MAG: hypothetical protein HRU75_11585 [Planctomycetia bacterium]
MTIDPSNHAQIPAFSTDDGPAGAAAARAGAGAAVAKPAVAGSAVQERRPPTPDRRMSAAGERRGAPAAARGGTAELEPDGAVSVERRGGCTAGTDDPPAEDRRSKLDRRRGPGRRRTDSRVAAEEGHMTEDQLHFLRAMDEYKRVNQRAFPTLTEVLDVLMYLGYRKVAPVGEFKMSKGRQTPLPGQKAAVARDDAGDGDEADSGESQE